MTGRKKTSLFPPFHRLSRSLWSRFSRLIQIETTGDELVLEYELLSPSNERRGTKMTRILARVDSSLPKSEEKERLLSVKCCVVRGVKCKNVALSSRLIKHNSLDLARR